MIIRPECLEEITVVAITQHSAISLTGRIVPFKIITALSISCSSRSSEKDLPS